MGKNYTHTLYASYIGYVTQAIVNNFAPLLFLTFQKTFAITLDKIALLVSINFMIQLLVDLLSARFMDRMNVRVAIVAAHAFAAAGLVGLAVLPQLLPSAFAGLLLATCIYAIGGGITEVLISPIVEACPTNNKEGHMSLLHSFYCIGQVLVIVLSTVFFVTVGIDQWMWLACLWALVPFANMFYYSRVPLAKLIEEDERIAPRQILKQRTVWFLLFLMLCAGASEQSMSQWASAFAEQGLGVSKAIGDLAGPCAFAVLMGTARAVYAKFSLRINLRKFMIASGILCVAAYLLATLAGNPVLGLIGCALTGFSVGIMWPGTFSIAAKKCRGGGMVLFALLALAGDLGCAAGPAFVGVISEAAGENLKIGILFAIIFPIVLVALLLFGRSIRNDKVLKMGSQV
ncbi:MAG: MFS transporter [Lachnospiraceae bacterium]